MTRLVIDRGNSSCKWAFFDRKAPLGSEPLKVLTTPSGECLPEDILQGFHPEACLYSSVGADDRALCDYLSERIPWFRRFSLEMKMPVTCGYQSPATLGLDRMAAAVGAWTLVPGRPALIVDMGTAITYDLMTGEGVYLGGNIAPGIWLRMKALHENTAHLPMVDAVEDFPFMGCDTVTAIQAGVMQGILLELEGYMQKYGSDYKDLATFLTGGDLIYFERRLKNRIFVGRNLVLTGLDRILFENAFSEPTI